MRTVEIKGTTYVGMVQRSSVVSSGILTDAEIRQAVRVGLVTPVRDGRTSWVSVAEVTQVVALLLSWEDSVRQAQQDGFCSATELVEDLGVRYEALMYWASSGRVQSFTIGGKFNEGTTLRMIRKADVQAIIKERAEDQAETEEPCDEPAAGFCSYAGCHNAKSSDSGLGLCGLHDKHAKHILGGRRAA